MLAAEASGLREGDILAGKYRIDRVLGAGGMGIVISARHVQLDTRVAIKLLLPAMLAMPDVVTRFEREARAAVRISSEHVARVFDVGTLETGAPYIVMEFLEGRDLSAWIRQQGPMPVALAVEFVLQTCVAVAEAHALGIVHRDLKPSNLFCIRRADGQLCIKVLDFGISKVTDPTGSGSGMSATKTSAILGSPLYMSPEQMASSKDVSPQSDVWALGVILYELVSGEPPFNGETLPEVCVKIATQPPPSLRRSCPAAPADFEEVVNTCLTRDRRGRYADVAALARALEPFAPPRCAALVDRIVGILQGAAEPLLGGGSTVPADDWPSYAQAASGSSSASRSRERAPRSRVAWAIVTALLVAGAAVVAALLFGRFTVTSQRNDTPGAVAPSATTTAPASRPSASPTALPTTDVAPAVTLAPAEPSPAATGTGSSPSHPSPPAALPKAPPETTPKAASPSSPSPATTAGGPTRSNPKPPAAPPRTPLPEKVDSYDHV